MFQLETVFYNMAIIMLPKNEFIEECDVDMFIYQFKNNKLYKWDSSLFRLKNKIKVSMSLF